MNHAQSLCKKLWTTLASRASMCFSMSLYKQISDDMKQAMKNRDSETLEVLRMLMSNLKNLVIETRKELEDADVFAAIKRDVKKLKDAAQDYAAGAREDLVAKAMKEVSILEGYLPASLPDEEIERRVKEILEAHGINSKSDIGKAMGAVMKELASVADGNKIREFVQKILQ